MMLNDRMEQGALNLDIYAAEPSPRSFTHHRKKR